MRNTQAQLAFWQMIDTWSAEPGWLCRKQLEAELGVDKSTISLWATGSRPMSVGTWQAICRLFRAKGEHSRAIELMQILVAPLDMEVSSFTVDLTGDLVERVHTVDEIGDDLARLARRLARDGELDASDRAELRPPALRLLRQARELVAALDGPGDE